MVFNPVGHNFAYFLALPNISRSRLSRAPRCPELLHTAVPTSQDEEPHSCGIETPNRPQNVRSVGRPTGKAHTAHFSARIAPPPGPVPSEAAPRRARVTAPPLPRLLTERWLRQLCGPKGFPRVAADSGARRAPVSAALPLAAGGRAAL